MSFYSHFRKKCIPEWREYYVSYKVFKQLFRPFKKTSKIYGQLVESKIQLNHKMYSIDSNDVGEEIDQLKIFEEKCMTLILTETEKIDSFFQLKFMEFHEEWERIQDNSDLFRPFRFEKAYKEKAQILKNAFHLFYMKVNYLIQFVNLNYDAISRLLRKHRKLTKNYTKMMQVSEIKMDDLFKNRYISQNSDMLIQLRDDVTATYLDIFYHRYNKDKGVKELKSLLKTRIISIWHSYFLFFFLGCTICLLIFILVMAIYGSIDPDRDETFKHIFPMFRGSAFIVLYIWCLGWNVYIWTRYHINYKKIFQFNYHYSTPTEILMRGTFFSSILLVIFIWYVVVNEQMGNLADGLNSLKIPKEFLPMILWVLLIAYLFFPSRTWFNGEGRLYFFKRIYRFLISPCVLIDNPSGFVADQLMSFVIPLQDLAYTICYYISRFRDYDNYSPTYCFTDTIFVGFLVAFFPGVFRTIHFIHYLIIGQNNINKKIREIKQLQIQNEQNVKKPIDNEIKKNNSTMIKKENDSQESSKKASTEHMEKVKPQPLATINENTSFQFQVEDSIVKLSDDSKISQVKVSSAETKPQDLEALSMKKECSDPFNYIEDNIPQSSELKKPPPEETKKNNSLIELKEKELKTLKESHQLNIMYMICLIIVLIVTVFSYLFGKYPDNKGFLGIWVTFAFMLSTYAFYLDVAKDWGLGQKNKKHLFLREKLGYQKKTFYYLAIIFDFFLRWVWVFSISPGASSKILRPELFIFFMGGFEMLRRAIWNFMVVEKTFITNLESFKCLYEYTLPFDEEEKENLFLEGRKKSSDNQKKKFSVMQSQDYDDDFKVRFAKHRGKTVEELKKGLLVDVQDVVETKEEKKGEEEDKAKTASSRLDKGEQGLSEKLTESILRGKEMLDSFVTIEKDVKTFEDNLNKRYDTDLKHRQENKQKSPFEVILKCFTRPSQEAKK